MNNQNFNNFKNGDNINSFETQNLVETSKSDDYESSKLLKNRKNNSKKDKDYYNFQTSLAVVNISAGLDGCDEQLLPASFRALEADLNFHPSLLGYITLAQTITLSMFSPLWGYLSDIYSRKWMLVFGTMLWGIATTLLAFINDFAQIILFRSINGMALGSVGPISQSILADASKNEDLGLSFGIVQLSSCIGRLIGGVVTTTFALQYIGMLRGWRFCFLVVGMLSMALSIVIALFVEDPPRQIKKNIKKKGTMNLNAGTGGIQTLNKSGTVEYGTFTYIKNMLKECFSKKSIIIIILECFTGVIPWMIFGFNTMFFQYCGMTDFQAALITGGMLIGAGIGGIFGGVFGDKMHNLSNNHGRPLLGQLSMFGRVPLVILTYVVLPKEQKSFEYFFLTCFLIGLTSVAGVAVNRPILSDVIRPDYRGTIFSITVSIEGIGSSLIGAPLFGYLSENVFHYQQNNLLISDMTEELRKNNANALAQTMFYLTLIPWILSFIFYSLLHFTYGSEYKQMNEIILEEYNYECEDIEEE